MFELRRVSSHVWVGGGGWGEVKKGKYMGDKRREASFSLAGRGEHKKVSKTCIHSRFVEQPQKKKGGEGSGDNEHNGKTRGILYRQGNMANIDSKTR